MEMHRHTFRKAERLCSKKHIETLFAGGSRTISAYPLRVVFMPVEEAKEPVQVLISVSKRHFKHAVDRNRSKRLIREAYRLNKQLLIEALGAQKLKLAFVWMSDDLADYTTIASKMKTLLERIGENLQQNE